MENQDINFKSILEDAYAYYQKGEQQKAIELFDQVLTVQQQNSVAFRTKGILLINLERFSEAISYFDNILKQNPQDNEILFSKAIALELLGKNEEAIPLYLKSLRIKYEDTESMINFIFHFLNRLRMWGPMEFYERLIDNSSSEPFAEFFKQFVKNEEQIELLYKKYLTRVPELDEIKYWQTKIFEKKNSDFLEAEIMKSSEANTIIQGKKYEGMIKKLFKKYLDRWDVKPEELNFYTQQIVKGKSIKTIEEEIKNSDENKLLPYWQNDD
tara:strand:+ start:67 stop:876 length:810 start_codon:yes stop_codon:yes gene_type:complete